MIRLKNREQSREEIRRARVQKFDEEAATLKSETLERLGYMDDPGDKEAWEVIEERIAARSRKTFLPLNTKIELARNVFYAIRRLDILQELLDDDDITEIMVIGKVIFAERKGQIFRWEKSFADLETVENIVQRIAGSSNRILNTRSPLADARLADGSRVHLVVAPIAVEGPVITIRRFPKVPIDMRQLIAWGSISEEAAAFLGKLVYAGYNLFISGGTGSGKTTFLNALSGYIPSDERVIVIEDTAELQIRGIPNLVRLEARGKNLEGENEITIRDLVRAALRMRPNRIIVGEVRGEEAVDLLQSMNTGHDGSISTGHGNSTKDMLSRLETMVLMGMEIPIPAIRNQIASGIDILVHLGRLRDRSRRVLEISEITGVEGEIQTNLLYSFEEEGEENGKVIGRLKRCGELENTWKWKSAGLPGGEL